MKKKETTAEDIRRIKRFNYTVLAVLAALAVLLLAWLGVRTWWAEFTPEKWSAYPDHRASMTADLLEDDALLGMTEEEVTALLGPNDDETGYYVKEDRHVYWLGARRTLVDSEWLLLDFDGGRVVSCSVATD